MAADELPALEYRWGQQLGAAQRDLDALIETLIETAEIVNDATPRAQQLDWPQPGVTPMKAPEAVWLDRGDLLKDITAALRRAHDLINEDPRRGT